MKLDELKKRINDEFQKNYAVYENAVYNQKNGFISNQSSYTIGFGDALLVALEIITIYDKEPRDDTTIG